MLKKYKLTLLLASVTILLPCIAGIVNQNVTLIVFPLILLALFWLCVFFTAKDKANETQNSKLLTLVLWIVPVLSLFVSASMITIENGKYISATASITVLMSALFISMGNYMPKCTRNHTLGIKIKHTLENDENWNATHRFAGKSWFLGGVIILFGFFLSERLFVMLVAPIMLAFVFAPIVYSYLYYRKQLKNGTYTVDKLPSPYMGKNGKTTKLVSTVAVVAILAVIAVMMFTGSVSVSLDDSSLTLDSEYWSKLEIPYDDIQSVEKSEDVDFGWRANGFSSAVLQLGNYHSDELGDYISYRCNASDTVIILRTDKTVYVLSLADNENTDALYEEILGKLE